MTIRGQLCKLLIFLRIHRPDCERCARLTACWGDDIRQRLKDLLETQPGSADNPKRTDDAA